MWTQCLDTILFQRLKLRFEHHFQKAEIRQLLIYTLPVQRLRFVLAVAESIALISCIFIQSKPGWSSTAYNSRSGRTIMRSLNGTLANNFVFCKMFELGAA